MLAVTAALVTSAAAVDVSLLGGAAAYPMPQVTCGMGPFSANHQVVKIQVSKPSNQPHTPPASERPVHSNPASPHDPALFSAVPVAL